MRLSNDTLKAACNALAKELDREKLRHKAKEREAIETALRQGEIISALRRRIETLESETPTIKCQPKGTE